MTGQLLAYTKAKLLARLASAVRPRSSLMQLLTLTRTKLGLEAMMAANDAVSMLVSEQFRSVRREHWEIIRKPSGVNKCAPQMERNVSS